MAEQYRSIQAENNTLRDYVISLQARLIESQGSYPEPPGNIDLSRPHTEVPPPVRIHSPPEPIAPQHVQHQQQQQQPAPTAPMSASAAHQLQQAAAQAAAAQASSEHLNNGAKHNHDEAQYLPASNEYPSAKRQKSDDLSAGATSATSGRPKFSAFTNAGYYDSSASAPAL